MNYRTLPLPYTCDIYHPMYDITIDYDAIPKWESVAQDKDVLRDKFRGCLLGGAVGDALGAPVEFMRLEEIRQRFGPDGITNYAPAYGGIGKITDDTQMTLFTAEGMLHGYVRLSLRGICNFTTVVYYAYLRWLKTQTGQPDDDSLFDRLSNSATRT